MHRAMRQTDPVVRHLAHPWPATVILFVRCRFGRQCVGRHVLNAHARGCLGPLTFGGCVINGVMIVAETACDAPETSGFHKPWGKRRANADRKLIR